MPVGLPLSLALAGTALLLKQYDVAAFLALQAAIVWLDELRRGGGGRGTLPKYFRGHGRAPGGGK